MASSAVRATGAAVSGGVTFDAAALGRDNFAAVAAMVVGVETDLPRLGIK